MADQELMAKRNVDVPDDRRMQFRIGVQSTLATCWSKATISLVMASMSPPASKALQSRAAATSVLLGLGVRLRRIFSEAVGRDQASVLRL